MHELFSIGFNSFVGLYFPFFMRFFKHILSFGRFKNLRMIQRAETLQ